MFGLLPCSDVLNSSGDDQKQKENISNANKILEKYIRSSVGIILSCETFASSSAGIVFSYFGIRFLPFGDIDNKRNLRSFFQ